MIIDSHQHFWRLDLPYEYGWLQALQHQPICRNYLPSDLRPHLQATGISKTVFVQTQHNVAESRWVLEMAKDNDFIAGVVGWVDLASEACEDQLCEFLGNPLFVGIRHVTQDEPDENFIIRPDVIRGLRVLQKHQVPFDLLFYTQHLKHAATLAAALPDLPMVIDHISKPKIKDQNIHDWSVDLRRAAAFPNICCKLSGMVTEADWTNWKPVDLKPYVEIAIDAFGPERCLFGTDWPVCELAASYETVFSTLRELTQSLSETERNLIFGETAKRFYRLQV